MWIRYRCLALISLALVPLALLVTPAPLAAQTVDEALARGDAAWAARGSGQEDGHADAAVARAVIDAYESALEIDPENLEAAWKLLRGIYFEGDYTTDDDTQKQAIYDRGRELTEAALERIAARVGGRKKLDKLSGEARREALADVPEAAAVYYWGAVNWGLWGRAFGTFAAARKGVGSIIRDYAQAAIDLDPALESGGGYRVLGKLHGEAPKVPFFTGWVDRDEAIRLLRLAVDDFPGEPINRLYLAETLLDHRKREAGDEALAMLDELTRLEPADEWLAEYAKIRRLARERLELEQSR